MCPFFRTDTQAERSGCAEGKLYKILTVCGKTFAIYYGYYDDRERNNAFVDPMPIYPDFLRYPCYTEEGFPFVTKMQDACECHTDPSGDHAECAECLWYRHGEELLGLCACPERRRPAPDRKDGETQ